MRLILVILLAAASFGGYRWWNEQRVDAVQATPSPNGFIPVHMPDGASSRTVLILLPPNCPSDAAERGAALARHLSSQGIPLTQASSMAFDVAKPTREQVAGIERAVAVFNRGPPTVFIGGMAMSNPTPAQAVAEYRRTQRGR